ncbi:MAG: hypothetical protein JL56_12455 [Desulfotomaculum sp. BICA1-6]|nr:MAG: hypothetical protein VR67_17300 [Peptococcaceae bacterium BRH_c8a]KJS72768.1 MAG: hypothetical protein JL56_12455 [Desulfotomaculum sp. BICA1-6]
MLRMTTLKSIFRIVTNIIIGRHVRKILCCQDKVSSQKIIDNVKNCKYNENNNKQLIFQVPARGKREPGENPGRSRHCNR